MNLLYLCSNTPLLHVLWAMVEMVNYFVNKLKIEGSVSADCVFPNQILVHSEGGAVWEGKRKKTKTHHLYHSDLLWKTKSSI